MKQQRYKAFAETGSRAAIQISENHHHRSSGFSLAEVMVLLTILCMVFILGIQWYVHSPMISGYGLWDGIKQVFTTTNSSRQYQTSEGIDVARAPLSSDELQTADGDLLIIDDAIAAGIPIPLAIQEGMTLHFGGESSLISLHVPGRVIVSSMPVGSSAHMADIHWFFPE